MQRIHIRAIKNKNILVGRPHQSPTLPALSCNAGQAYRVGNWGI
jgi:hypothetical protein